MADNRIIIELTGKDDASATLISAFQRMAANIHSTGEASRRTAGAVDGLRGRLDTMAGSLARQVAVWVSVAGAMYAARRAMEGWYGVVSAGIKAMDDYRTSIYSSAAMMVTMSESARPAGELYASWKDYFVWLEKRANEADRTIAASGREIFETARELAIRGTAAMNQEQVELAGRITDLVKGLTRVTGEERTRMQIAQEIRALYAGQLVPTAALVQHISKIDTSWKEHLKTAIKTGTLYDYLAKVVPKIKEFTTDLGNTWESVSSTLQNVKNLVLREAFGEAYEDMVGWGQQFIDLLVSQGELTDEGQRLAGALGEAWSRAKVHIGEALKWFIDHPEELVGTVQRLAGATGEVAGAAARAAKHFNDMVAAIEKAVSFFSGPFGSMLAGGAFGSRFGPVGAAVGAGAGLAIGVGTQGSFGQGMPEAEHAASLYRPAPAQGLLGYGSESEGHVSAPRPRPEVPWTPKLRRPGEAADESGGKGGGGAGGATQLANMLDTLNKELAKLRQGSLAEIEEWYTHVLNQIRRYAGEAQAAEQAIALANQVKAAKVQKLETEFSRWYAQSTGDRLEGLKLEEEDYTRKYQGILGAREKISEVFDQRRLEQQSEWAQKSLEYQKEALDLAKGMTPYLQDQLRLKERILDLEYQITLEGIKRNKEMPQALKDEAAALAALRRQAGAYQLRKEAGGVSGWAMTRADEARGRESRGMAEIFDSAERFMQDGLSSGIQGVLAHDKKSLKKIGETMVQGLMGELTKRSVTRVFDKLGQMLAPQAGRGGVGRADKTGEELSQAAQGLQGAAAGFNTNALQFGMAAGGLLLSGIGIATNSEALVYAGMALQLAAAAVQIYQMLSSTTSATALTTAAGALTASAIALKLAAIALAVKSPIPFAQHGLFATQDGPVYVHAGERVLSPAQTRAYDAGHRGGGGGMSINIGVINAQGSGKGVDWQKITRQQIGPEIARQIKLGRIRVG